MERGPSAWKLNLIFPDFIVCVWHYKRYMYFFYLPPGIPQFLIPAVKGEN